MKGPRVLSLFGGLSLLLAACTAPAAAPGASPSPAPGEQVVYVYSGRHYGLMEPAFAQFTKETGIAVRFTFGNDAELRERIKAEGPHTLADVLLTVDAGNLWLTAREGLLQPIRSQVLERNIPAHLQDPEKRWAALSVRARTIMYHPDRVRPEELSTYEALADPKWRGRLCLRPGTHVYTQSLVASLIAARGEAEAERVVRGWAANNPTYINSDTRLLETIAAGGCDVAVTNTYYLGRLLNANSSFPVRAFWANQGDRGTHINVSGGSVTANARNRDNGIRLLEWLSGQGQRLFVDGNFEYPANPQVNPLPLIAAWGTYRADTVSVSEFGRLQADAIKLLGRAGYR